MIPLIRPLQLSLGALHKKPVAAIIDDDLAHTGEKELADWIALKESLQDNATDYEQIKQRIAELGLSPEAPPSSTECDAILEKLPIESLKVREAFAVYQQKSHMLLALRDFLSNLGFEVKLYPNRPDISTLKDTDLFMVDYQMRQEEAPGETAVQLIAELMETSESQQKPPPMVILISKAIDATQVEKWDAVASTSGYFRFNYDFLNKEDFTRDPSLLSLLLLNLLQHKPVADSYYSQLRSLRSEANAVAAQVMNDLFQVTPPEAQVFKYRIQKEGKTLSEEFTDVFTEHFANKLRSSVVVKERMCALEEAIDKHGALAPPKSHRDTLHKLYAGLLYSEPKPSSPPEFGDIYKDTAGKHLLVLSQECDLTLRQGGTPKVDRVLAVEGSLSASDVSSSAFTSLLAKPILLKGEAKLSWLCWDIKKPVVIAYNDLRSAAYVKLWRMRFQDAEDIQHQFSSSLTRVALNAMPGVVNEHECKLYSGRQNQFIGSSVSLYEIEQAGQTFLAIAPDCRALFFGLTYPFVALDKIMELGKFAPKAEFLQRLKHESITVCQSEGALVFVKSQTGTIPEGMVKWEPNTNGEGSPESVARAGAAADSAQ